MRAWWIYLLAGLLATGSYFLLPGARVQDVVYDLIGVFSAGAIVAGIRLNRPERPLPWWLLAVGLSLLVAGNLMWTAFGASSLALAWVSGVLYLTGYPAIAAGLMLLSWKRSGGWVSFIDPAIVAAGAGLLSWVFLMEPFAADASLTLPDRLFLISYPFLDLLLLAAVARLLMVSGQRLPAYLLLTLGTVCILVADTSYVPTILVGISTTGDPVNIGWMLDYVFFGAAALHPSMAANFEVTQEDEERITWRRFALLAAALLMIPGALMIEAALGESISVPAISVVSAVLFVLILARMAGVTRLRERTLRRERVLRKFGETLVAAPNKEGIHRALLDAAMDLAKPAPGAGASLAVGSVQQMIVVATAGTHPRALQGLQVAVADLPQSVRQALLAGECAELRNFDPALFWKVLGDLDADSSVQRRRDAIESLLMVPLYVRGEFDGMISLSGDTPFPSNVRESLEALSVNASLALESAALSEELHQRRSEAWFGSLVRNASGVIMILDEGGTTRYVSPSCKPILDYEPEDLIGREALALVHPEDKLRVRTHFAGISGKPGVRMTLEFRMRHADGSWRYVESVANNLLDDPGVRGVVINCRDVTERKKYQESLEEAELRFRTLVERMPAVTYTNPLDESGHSVYISPRVEDMLGYSVEEGREDPGLWDRMLHAEDRERVTIEEARTSATGDPFRMEYRMISREGRVVWVRDESVLVRDDEGKPRFWQGFMLDITGRKNAEEALHYRFGFEKIIAETSTKFVDLAPEEVDSGIEEALRKIGAFSGADRSYVFLFSEEGTTTENTHEWCAEGIEPQIENLKNMSPDVWPLAMRKFRNGEVHHVPQVADLPEEAALEKEECEAEHIQSFVQIPMLREGALVGFIGFDSVRSERVWSEDEIMLLKTVGELFTNALERRRVQRVLQEAEERYRSLVENIPAVTYTHPAGDSAALSYISPQIESVLGYTAEEYISEPGFWIEKLHPDDKERVLEEDKRTDETFEPYGIEYRMLSRDGRYVWVREEAVVVRDERNKPSYWQGFLWDITDRKEAEEALRKSEASLAEAQRIAHIGNWEWDVRSGEVRWSDEVFRIYGYSPGEVAPTLERLMDVVHPEDRELVRKRIHEALHEGKTYDFNHRIALPDGTERVVHRRAEVVLDEDRQPLRLIGTIHDITERVMAEEALRESETKHRALVENIPAVTYTHPADGSEAPTEDMTYISPQAEALLGYTAEERLAHLDESWIDMLHPEDRERVLAEDERTNRTGGPFSIEYRWRTSDGRYIWVRNEAVLVRDENDNPQYWQGFLWDITDRKEMEEAIREAEDRYRTLVEQIPAAIYLQDVEHNSPIRYISPQIESMTGYTPEEYTSRPNLFRSTMHPGDLESVMAEGERATRTGEPHSVEYRTICRDGHLVWVRDEAVLVRDARGLPKFWQGVMLDITAQKDLEERLAHQAFHDELTGLPNRALFADRLKQALARTERRERSLAVLFVDLDNFKFVNDSLGHEAGDILLTETARRIEKCIRPEDTAARLGGDEFTVLLEDLGDTMDAAHVAERILEELQAPFFLEGTEAGVTVSIGITLGGSGPKSPSDLLRDADTALYRAKARGKNGYAIFDEIMNHQAGQSLQLEADLLGAVERGELVTHYQPKLDLSTGHVVGWEALVCWQHPLRGLVYPSEFIPVAEETGLIVSIGSRVLREACFQLKDWRNRSSSAPDWTMSVNLSARQLQRPEIADEVAGVLKESGLEPASLILEVTWSAESSTHTLRRLKELGVQIAIDDFGTGYTSLSYLKSFPVDILKVDKSFVDGLGRNAGDNAIVETVIRLAHALNLKAVAEGIETAEQADTLRALGCEMGQGYYFARPLPANEINYPLDLKSSPEDSHELRNLS